jgi:hypothetical protein
MVSQDRRHLFKNHPASQSPFNAYTIDLQHSISLRTIENLPLSTYISVLKARLDCPINRLFPGKLSRIEVWPLHPYFIRVGKSFNWQSFLKF